MSRHVFHCCHTFFWRRRWIGSFAAWLQHPIALSTLPGRSGRAEALVFGSGIQALADLHGRTSGGSLAWSAYRICPAGLGDFVPSRAQVVFSNYGSFLFSHVALHY
jgi:hypothetical protein